MTHSEAYKLDTNFYVDEEDGVWYVFGTESGFAYFSCLDEGEAEVALRKHI